MKKYLLLLIFSTCLSMAQEKPYGIGEMYYDTKLHQMTFGLSTYQPIYERDSILFSWSSYSYYMDQEIMSRHWVQYWFTSNFGVGAELEFWYTTNRAYLNSEWQLRKIYFTPRVGVQYKLW